LHAPERRAVEEVGHHPDEGEAEGDHQAEGPEERPDGRDRVLGGLRDLRIRGLPRIVDVAQQKEGKPQIGGMRLEGRGTAGSAASRSVRIVWSAS
jgi:hypothetical protein